MRRRIFREIASQRQYKIHDSRGLSSVATAMYPWRSGCGAGGGPAVNQAAAPLRAAGALRDPAAGVGVYSSAAYAAVAAAAAAAAQGYEPFTVDSVAFYPPLQVRQLVMRKGAESS